MQWYNNPAIISFATLVLSAVITAISNKFPAWGPIWQFIRTVITGVTASELRAIHYYDVDQKSPKDPPKTPPSILPTATAFFCCVLCLSVQGCTSTLQKDLNTALVFESSAQTAEENIVLVAQAAIALLPADKQAQAQIDLTKAAGVATQAFAAKDAAIQAAIDANSASGLNLPQLVADITAAIQAIVALANAFGATKDTTEALQHQLLLAQLRTGSYVIQAK